MSTSDYGVSIEFKDGIQYIVNTILDELETLRQIEGDMKEPDAIRYSNFGGSPVMIFTADKVNCGAFAIYLAKQLKCKALCCDRTSDRTEIKRIIAEATKDVTLVLNIESFKDDDRTVLMDNEDWNDTSLLIKLFKFIVTKPFTEQGVTGEDIKDDMYDIEYTTDSKIVHLKFNKDSLYYDMDGPKFKSFVLLYAMYEWLINKPNVKFK